MLKQKSKSNTNSNSSSDTIIDDNFIYELFLKAIASDDRDVSEEEKDYIHVTHLVYDCLRRAWFSHYYGSEPYEYNTLVRMWIGRAIHKIPILKLHEFKVKWDEYKIIGFIDEYDPDLELLIEKKTVRQVPKQPYSNHVKQVLYYCVLLKKNNYNVKHAYIVYIDVINFKIKPFRVQVSNLDDVESEMIRKVTTLRNFIEKFKIPPPPSPSSSCTKCPFINLCFKSVEL